MSLERKRATEKAKAAQVVRHLKMRLSYARLKVDHGWHNQNLSEVENLYYRHYRQSRPGRNKSPLPQPDPSTYLDESLISVQIPFQNLIDPLNSPQNAPTVFPSVDALRQTPMRDGTLSEQQTELSRRTSRTQENNPNLKDASHMSDQGNQTISLGLPEFMGRLPATPPLSPIIRNNLPTMPRTPVSLPPSTPLKSFSSNALSSNPISNPSASPTSGVKMTYDSFWSSLSASTPVSFKSSLPNATHLAGLNTSPLKGVTEVIGQNKR